MSMITIKVLDQKIRASFCREQEALTEVLPLIHEMDERKGYLDFDTTSTYAYLVKVGYSGTASDRRITAARFLAVVPKLLAKLHTGAINMTQLMTVKAAIKQAAYVTSEQICELINIIEFQNDSVTQRLVAQFLDLSVIQKCKRRVQKDGSVIYEFTVSPELDEKIQRAQERNSHKVPSGRFIDLVEYLVDKDAPKPPVSKCTTATVVTPKMRSEVLRDANYQCQHIYDDGTRCTSRYQLQVDHIIGLYRNGSSARSNLQALCAQHNRSKFRRETGFVRSPRASYSVH